MIDLIQAKIDEWRDVDDIVALFFDAEGDKAFSAGVTFRRSTTT